MILNTSVGFEYDDMTKDNDFIILKLGSPLIFNKEIQPACLPSSKDYLGSDSTEDMCFTSGWGTLEFGKLQINNLIWGTLVNNSITYMLSQVILHTLKDVVM